MADCLDPIPLRWVGNDVEGAGLTVRVSGDTGRKGPAEWSLRADLFDSQGKSMLVNRFCQFCLDTTSTPHGQRVVKVGLKTEDGLPWSDRSLVLAKS